MMQGAYIFIESLLREGVDTIFGHPGGAILPINDALYDGRIRHILTRHEQGAVHMAEGYARATGRPGVVLVTSGPGGTNVVTGLANAFMDSTPIVVFTGQVPTAVIGNDAFQEADIVGITRSCTKHNYLVADVKDLARTVKEAFYIASSGRPGPVLVDIPKDVATGDCEFVYPDQVNLRGYRPTIVGHAGQIRRAAEMIEAASRPVIYAGGGVVHSGAAEELRQLGELTATPVTNTLMGLGGFPGVHELWLGMLGMHGTFAANTTMDAADLVIAIGARFDDRVTGNLGEFCTGAKFIHIDIDPSSIGKNVRVDLPIVGDVKHCLLRLLDELREVDKDWSQAHALWLTQVNEWKAKNPLQYAQDAEGELLPQYVCEQIYEVTQGDAIITTEVGQHQMWAAQYYHCTKPRQFVTSGGLGTMGFGFPAAIGAQVAFPEAVVIDIAGDGSFQMTLQELATVVQYDLPVIVALLNNHSLGMVRQWQQFFYDGRYADTSLEVSPDFVKLAEAYGAVGLRATKADEVRPVLEEAIRLRRPVVIDFVVKMMENVFPMIPSGGSIKDMLLA
ncbi:MAG: biosynthetic-type acetolactate synthase large subunit [bacterium]|nr:biosynthetic-type acetolactate synthase large subunit [bacterium]